MLKTVLISIALALALGAGWFAYSFWSFSRVLNDEVAALRAASKPNTETVSEDRLAELPEPVVRHLRQAGVVGQTIPSIIRVVQSGRIRANADANWLPFEAVETYTTNPPGFVWKADFPGHGMPLVFGRDHYLDGDGRITMKFLGAIDVANTGGGKLNEASLMRYLNETMWFPAALAGSNMHWQAVDQASADVTLTDRGMSVTARLHFDAEGRIVNFVATRFNTDLGDERVWETPLDTYAQLGGMNVPRSGQGVWQLDDGPFAYIELDVKEITLE